MGTHEALDKVLKIIKNEGGHFAITYGGVETSDWTAALTFGIEEENSNIAGHAAYGIGDTAEEALQQLVNDLEA